MKLNNKGFAITAVLYGLLILCVLFVGSYLIVLSIKKNRVDTITSDLEQEYIIDMVLDNFTFPLTVPADGTYNFSLTDNEGNDLECTAELSINNVIEFNNSLTINTSHISFDKQDCNDINNKDSVTSVNKITYVKK